MDSYSIFRYRSCTPFLELSGILKIAIGVVGTHLAYLHDQLWLYGQLDRIFNLFQLSPINEEGPFEYSRFRIYEL